MQERKVPLTPQRMEKLVRRVWPAMLITRVFHPNIAEMRVIEMPNGVNVRFERGPHGYQLKDGTCYPPGVSRAAGT